MNRPLYPRVGTIKRKPNPETEGSINVGKTCVVCDRWTTGQIWIQTSYMRGDDELVYACYRHIKSNPELITAFQDKYKGESA